MSIDDAFETGQARSTDAISPPKSPLFDKFQQDFGSQISQVVREMYEATEFPAYDLNDVLESEVGFTRSVVDAYERWATEDNPIVLWDIDHTIGKYDLATEPPMWRFRPSIQFLLRFLQDEFPNVTNGILTDRTEIEAQLDDADLLQPLSMFFDRHHLYSSRGIELKLSEEEINDLDQEVYRSIGRYPVTGHKEKLVVLRRLTGDGLNVKSIDDNHVAESMGDNGVCVFECQPKL